ncbi:hypothetical protein [uncultured Tenacibaculum sp.]|uniref:hypothetical protein n=1 Tax=uncultured Tenacibaculum sp. TaxID=174713 RepID=UPI00261BD1C4|nr:hypothetical protein [uncultured Tenacibaculum sp.]
MTISFIIECVDCSENYRIRYGMGNNFPQSASFQCTECSKKIKIGFKSKGEDRIIEGCRFIENGGFEKDVKVVNLHPEIPTDKDRLNDPSLFQTMGLFQQLNNSNADIFKFKELQYIWSQFYSEWIKIEPLLRIVAKKNKDELKRLKNIDFDVFSDEFHQWLGIFIRGKKDNIFEKINTEFLSIDSSEIKNYLNNEDKLIKQIYALCNVYMRHSENFQSTIFHQKYGWELTSDMTANVHWEDIESVYGDLYEIVGDLLTIPTMINNIKQGRDFDQFNTPGFTLDKFLKTDKAGRGTNFQSNPNLKQLTEFYFPWLRNGTHHKNSTFNSDTHEIILGVGKGGGTEKKINLIEYVRACNELFEVGIILSSLILHLKK